MTGRCGSNAVACALLVLASCSSPGAIANNDWVVLAGSRGVGTAASPFGTIQEALGIAQPGDRISVRPGIYREQLRTRRGGQEDRPITVVAEHGRGSVVVTHEGRVLTIAHPFLEFDGLVFDGEYGWDDVVVLTDQASHTVLRNAEVRRSSRDLIDIGAPQQVLIENSLIHHALNAANARTDAHGVAAGSVRDLTIRRTEIHTFSGDGIQIDPRRSAPGWDRVVIEGSRIWLAPLPAAENGFAAGSVTGENAVDTKADADLPRSSLVIRDTEVSGFRGGLIGNMAAFNLKEHVAVTIDGVTVANSEIGFRLRGSRSRPGAGAEVSIQNTVVYETHTAFRYEDDLTVLRIWNTTIGLGVQEVLRPVASRRTVPDVRNVLTIERPLPRWLPPGFNLTVGREQVADAAQHDYSLAQESVAIDSGVTLPEVVTDRAGGRRPQGPAFDIGAYERTR